MSFFKHIETTASEITKNQPVTFNTVAENQRISYRSFSSFSCVLLLSYVLLTFSVLFSPHFCRDQAKMLFDIRWKGKANLTGPGKGYFC